MSEVPTYEELRRVRRFECSVNGHSFREVVAGTGGPIRVICDRCAASWRIHPDDVSLPNGQARP